MAGVFAITKSHYVVYLKGDHALMVEALTRIRQYQQRQMGTQCVLSQTWKIADSALRNLRWEDGTAEDRNGLRQSR